MRKARRSLAVLLTLSMALGMMSGMSLVASAAANSTDEIIASQYSAVEGVVGQAGMFFPNQAETTTADGIANLRNGNWVRYDDVTFSGNEIAFAVDYATRNEIYLGNLEVYLDEINPDNRIVIANNLSGGEWNWATVKTNQVTLLEPVAAGTYDVIIVGLEPTVKADATSAPDASHIVFGMRSFKFVEGEWPETAPSTETVLATSFDSESGYAGTGWRQGMNLEAGGTGEGMHGIRNGNWLQYDNIEFDGTEEKFSIEYTSQSGDAYGNFDVHIVNSSGEAVIVEARDVNTGNSWTYTKTMEFALKGPVKPGAYSVKITGLPMTKHSESESWGGSSELAGFYDFSFIKGEGLSGDYIEPGAVAGPADPSEEKVPVGDVEIADTPQDADTTAATEDFVATEDASQSGADEGDTWGDGGQIPTVDIQLEDETVTAIDGLKNNRWVEFDNIWFTGREAIFAGDFYHGENASVNFEVYIDSIAEGNLIAAGTDLRMDTGFGTFLATLGKKVQPGRHSVIIKGLSAEGQAVLAADADTVALYGFSFESEPKKDAFGRYLFADSFTGAGSVSNDATYGTDPYMPKWIGDLNAGSEVIVPNVPFTKDMEYISLHSRHQGVQVDVYADSVSEENKIATIGNSRPNFGNGETAFFEVVSVPLTKELEGHHDLIFKVNNSTDLGAFELLTESDVLDMRSEPVMPARATTTWKDLWVGENIVGKLQDRSVLIYELVNMNAATGMNIGVSQGNGKLEIKAYDNDSKQLVKLAELNVATATTGPTTLSTKFAAPLDGVNTLYVTVANGYNITLDLIQLVNDFELVGTAMYDEGDNYVSPRDVGFAWKPGTEYTFKATVAGVPEGTPQLVAAIYDAQNRVIAAGISEAGGELSATLTAPQNANYEGAYTVTYLWDADSQRPMADPVKEVQEITIGCIGDSITEGHGGGPYIPYMVPLMPEVAEISNFGKGGATVESTINGQAFLEEALEAKCSVYTIMLGTNEANNRWHYDAEQFASENFVETYKSQYRTLIAMIKEANPNAKIFLATNAEIWTDSEQGLGANTALHTYVLPAIKAIAEEYDFDVIDLNAEMDRYLAVEGNSLSTWGYVDFLHMSAAGSQKIGEFFAQELNKYLGFSAE